MTHDCVTLCVSQILLFGCSLYNSICYAVLFRQQVLWHALSITPLTPLLALQTFFRTILASKIVFSSSVVFCNIGTDVACLTINLFSFANSHASLFHLYTEKSPLPSTYRCFVVGGIFPSHPHPQHSHRQAQIAFTVSFFYKMFAYHLAAQAAIYSVPSPASAIAAACR